jgi:Cu(I)/Ag(I) efflux system protein CusF
MIASFLSPAFLFIYLPLKGPMMKTLNTVVIVSTLLIGAAHAQTAARPEMGTMNMGTMNMEGAQKTAPMGAMAMVDGEVRKVDKDTKKITLKHGEIKNLGMPGMTMVFQVKDSAMLDKVQAGDKVQFKAERPGGALVITEIELRK